VAVPMVGEPESVGPPEQGGAMSDERDAYRTRKGMVGRSIRRGTKKGLKAVAYGVATGRSPLGHLAADAAKDAAKAYSRSKK
jgi:hypothetical protein